MPTRISASRLRNAALLLIASASIQCSGAVLAQPAATFDMLAGEYTVVSVRRSSLVASPSTLVPGQSETALGQTITIDRRGLKLAGIGCESWTLTEADEYTDIGAESGLADLRLPPLTPGVSTGDKRIGRIFDVRCEGEAFTTIYQADRRVLAMTWQNSAAYLILEKPLGPDDARMLTHALLDMKFLSSTDVEPMSDDMLDGVRAYYMYRQPDRDAAVPLRPAITENLLDRIVKSDE